MQRAASQHPSRRVSVRMYQSAATLPTVQGLRLSLSRRCRGVCCAYPLALRQLAQVHQAPRACEALFCLPGGAWLGPCAEDLHAMGSHARSSPNTIQISVQRTCGQSAVGLNNAPAHQPYAQQPCRLQRPPESCSRDSRLALLPC